MRIRVNLNSCIILLNRILVASLSPLAIRSRWGQWWILLHRLRCILVDCTIRFLWHGLLGWISYGYLGIIRGGLWCNWWLRGLKLQFYTFVIGLFVNTSQKGERLVVYCKCCLTLTLSGILDNLVIIELHHLNPKCNTLFTVLIIILEFDVRDFLTHFFQRSIKFYIIWPIYLKPSLKDQELRITLIVIVAMALEVTLIDWILWVIDLYFCRIGSYPSNIYLKSSTLTCRLKAYLFQSKMMILSMF